MQKRPNYLLIIALCVEVLFIVVLAVSLSRVMQSPEVDPDDINAQPSITIDGLGSRFPGLSADFVRKTENQLFEIVQNNNVDVKLGTTVAQIRDDSVNKVQFEKEKYDFYNFIVDIPELEQSYQLFLTYSWVENNQYIDPNGTMIPLCLSDAETKVYPEFECRDLYDQKTRNLIGLNSVAYFHSDKYYVVVGQSTIDKLKVIVTYHDESSDNVAVALNELKDSIRKLGISPDLFTYDVEEFKGN